MFFSDLVREEGRPPVLAHMCYEPGSSSSVKLWLFTKRPDAEELAGELPMNEASGFKSRIQDLPESSDEPSVHLRGALAQSFIHYIGKFSRDPVDMVMIEAPQICFVWDPISTGPKDAVICWYKPDDGFQIAIVHSQEQGGTIARELEWASETDKAKLTKRIDGWRMPPSSTGILIIGGQVARVLGGPVLVEKIRADAKRRAN